MIEWIEGHPASATLAGIVFGALAAIQAARTAYRGVNKQINNLRESEAIQRELELRALYNAIAADLDAVNKSLAGLRDALADKDETEKRGIVKSVFLASRHTVWEKNAEKIGILHPNHAANIIETYRFLDGLKGRAEELDLANSAHRDDLAGLISAAISQIDIVLSGLPIRPSKEELHD